MNLINELRMLAEDLYVNGYNRYASAMSQAADRLEAAEQTAQDYLRIDGEKARIAQRLEAAEKARDDVAQQLAQSERGKRAISEERDALRAKIVEMERQEPVAWHTFDGEGGYDYRSYAAKKDQMGSLISRLQRPGYDLQKEQAIQEAIVMLRQCNAQSKPDCGEAGHDEGRCGNAQCLPGAQTKGEEK